MMGTYKYYIERIEKFLSPTYWSDINIHSGVSGRPQGPTSIKVYEPSDHSRPLVSEVLQLSPVSDYFCDTQVGASFGPSWTTKWFRISFIVSAELAGKRIAVRWDSDSEAMLYSATLFLGDKQCNEEEGKRYLQSFTGGGGSDRRDLYIIPGICVTGQQLDFLVEMACNGMFGNGNNGMIRAPNPDRMFTLSQCELVEVRESAMGLYWDMTVLYELAKSLPETSSVGAAAVAAANNIINIVNMQDEKSILAAREIAAEVLLKEGEMSTSKLDHDVTAVGHCHIDTAWLWPYAETRRKIARSWSTQAGLLESAPITSTSKLSSSSSTSSSSSSSTSSSTSSSSSSSSSAPYDGYNATAAAAIAGVLEAGAVDQSHNTDWMVVASQAVQWEWLLEDHPQLFQRIQRLVSQGKFVPIGGSYVEFDANIPSGESMIRQFLYGGQFFLEKLGCKSRVFWLPDTFGYSGQLPQICQGFGIPYFLSQKLSWNLFNKFPHSTFLWEGIDGSTVLAHFPPADTYNAAGNAEELLKCAANHSSKMFSNRSLLLFGHGDGGGGPALSHLERLFRLRRCSGMPRIHLDQRPEHFFEEVEVKDFRLPSSLAALEQWDEDSRLTAVYAATTSSNDGSQGSPAMKRKRDGGSDVVNTSSYSSSSSTTAPSATVDTATSAAPVATSTAAATPATVVSVTRRRSNLDHLKAGEAISQGHHRHRLPPPRWVGELYLELHSGTLTSQAKLKKQNRQCENHLRTVEALLVYALIAWWKKSDRDEQELHPGMSKERSELNPGMLKECMRETKKLWKDLLLNQFHDVLPGSSIGMVYEDSDRMLSHVIDRCSALASDIMKILSFDTANAGRNTVAGTEAKQEGWQQQQHVSYVFNPTSFNRICSLIDHEYSVQKVLQVNAFGFTATTIGRVGSALAALPRPHPLLSTFADQSATTLIFNRLKVNEVSGTCSSARNTDGTYTLTNECVCLRVSSSGGIISLIDKRTTPHREVIDSKDDTVSGGSSGSGGCGFGNRLMLYDDVPFFWDAWDTFPYHIHTGGAINTGITTTAAAATSVSASTSSVRSWCSDDNHGMTASLTFELSGWGGGRGGNRSKSTTTDTSSTTADAAGTSSSSSSYGAASTLKQTITITSGSPAVVFHTEVFWREAHKLLKVEFPLTVRSPHVAYEIQDGLLYRPTHNNTPYDAAMHEVSAQRFADLSEAGYGVALLNDCKYGYSCRGSTLCLSLLRAPKAPDANCDMGVHTFNYALLPHIGGSVLEGRVVEAATAFNSHCGVIGYSEITPDITATSVSFSADGLSHCKTITPPRSDTTPAVPTGTTSGPDTTPVSDPILRSVPFFPYADNKSAAESIVIPTDDTFITVVQYPGLFTLEGDASEWKGLSIDAVKPAESMHDSSGLTTTFSPPFYSEEEGSAGEKSVSGSSSSSGSSNIGISGKKRSRPGPSTAAPDHNTNGDNNEYVDNKILQIVVRFVETAGSRGVARVRTGFKFSEAILCDLAEHPYPASSVSATADSEESSPTSTVTQQSDKQFSVSFEPYKILSVLINIRS